MSSPLNHEMNDMQPPPKRQRILPERRLASPPRSLSQSRPMSAQHHEKITDASSSASPPAFSNQSITDNAQKLTGVQETDSSSSIEAALGVPTRILFRQVGGEKTEPGGKNRSNGISGRLKSKSDNNHQENRTRLRPLLSRQEAEQFLRVTLLAQEIDILVDLSETVLERRRFARLFRRDILLQGGTQNTNGSKPNDDRPWKNPWLSTLGPILDVLEHRQPKQNLLASNQRQNPQEDILHHIHNELTRLYHALEACGIYDLERSAEQNRSLVASLTDILGYALDNDGQNDDDTENGRTSAVRNLAREKASLAKLQDLLAKRVRSLLVVLCHSRATVTTESQYSSDDEDGTKMGAQIDSGIHNQQVLFDEQLSSPSTDGNKDAASNNKSSSTDDDESSILSLEEILTPLEVVCDELFDQDDKEATKFTTVRVQNDSNSSSNDCCDNFENERTSGLAEQQQIQQEQAVQEQTANETFLLKPTCPTPNTSTGNSSALASTEDDADPMAMVPLEMSQRTIGAAATILSLAGEANEDDDLHRNQIIQPASKEMTSGDIDKKIIGEPEASQRAVGAATTMMALATKTGRDFPPQKTSTLKQNDLETNGNSRVDPGVVMNKNQPHTQQCRGKDDDSFIEDPPSSDGETGHDETSKKDETSSNERVGIFDVVDVLTPHSQS